MISVANESRPANGISVRSLVDSCADRAATICPAVEHLTTFLGSNNTSSFESVRSAVLNIGSPNIAVRHSGSGAGWNPGVCAIVVWNLDSHIGGFGILVCRIGPRNILIPVHLTGSRPIRVLRIVTNTTVTEYEVLIAKVLRLTYRDQASNGYQALGELVDDHGEPDLMTVRSCYCYEKGQILT